VIHLFVPLNIDYQRDAVVKLMRRKEVPLISLQRIINAVRHI